MVMKRLTCIAAVALFIAANLWIAPSAQALPRDWWETDYYDCNFNWIGYDLFDCSAHHSYGGVQYGAFKHYYQYECSTNDPVDDSWWWWNGSAWVPYAGQTC
jgi:hypothetical protein